MRLGINAEQQDDNLLYIQVQIYHGKDDSLLTWGTTTFDSEKDYTNLLQLITRLNELIKEKEKEKVYVLQKPIEESTNSNPS